MGIFGLVAPMAWAQSAYYVYQAEAVNGSCVYPSSATAGSAPITRLIGDDVLAESAYAGRPVTALSATLYNYAGNFVSFRPLFRFWQANGTISPLSGLPGPGTYYSQGSNVGFRTSILTLAPKAMETVEFAVPAATLSVPATRFWAAIGFDNGSNSAGFADANELNGLGVMPGTPNIGSSGAGFFRSSLATDLLGVSNPAGTFEASNLAIGVGIAGQDFHGTIFLNDVVSPMAQSRSITISAKSGNTTLATKTLTFSGEAVSQRFWITVPAELPSGASNPVRFEVSGQPFLRNTALSSVPVPPSANPASINLGSIALTNGDVDASGEVDAVDIDEVIAAFGQIFPGGANPFADVDCSGEVDAVDIDIVIANFGAVDN